MAIEKHIVSNDKSIYEAWPDVVLTDGGKLICVFSECESHGDRTNARLVLCESTDRGKTWSDRIIVASDPRYNLCEVSILECEDGTLVAFMRENSFQGYDMMKAISHDKGETWEGVYNTPMCGGHRPTTGFLNDGSVMVTYRFHYKHPEGMADMFGAFLSADTLTKSIRSEQSARIFPIDCDRNIDPDGGYTGWVQFDDGEIYVVNYIKDDADKAQIRGYSFKKEDIILP